jgi:hypothetical protein
MKRHLVALLLTLAALPAAARIVILPPDPTTKTPVSLRLFVACQYQSHQITTRGSGIRVHITRGAEICDPPIATAYTVPLGTLSSGEHLVEVTVDDENNVVESTTILVRNGNATQAEIHPFAVPAQPFGAKVRISSDTVTLCGATCAGVSVNVGGVTLSGNALTKTADGALWFTAPAHTPGLVDVTVTTPSTIINLPASLYFFDLTGPPSTSVFERILFPVLFQTGGAGGSQWVSEATISNPKPWFIETWNHVDPLVCIDYPCTERLHPGVVLSFNGIGYPQGVALLAPRAEAENLAFSLRVRDVAKEAEGLGTEVPVVRERDMFTNTDLTLLDVPLDPGYRVKLRMYVFDSGEHDAFVALRGSNAGPRLPAILPVPIRRSCSEPACAWTPWYGEVDLPAGRPGERVNVYVSIGGIDTPAWAFASVTNNRTQQVTLVTPDGAGGIPCDPCEVP